MPIPVGVTKFVLQGTLAGGEIWQTGFWQLGAVSTPADANTAAQGVWTAFSNTGTGQFGKAFQNTNNNQVQMSNCSAYSYPHGGPTADVVGTYGPTPVTGTSIASALPDQVAMCVTVLSAMAGASHRGRMYIPVTAVNLATGALFSTSDVSSIVNGLKAALNAAGGAIVVSQHLDSYVPAVGLRADQRPDIQRRRANRQSRGVATAVTL
jgi:hypothetical protein